MMGTIASNLTKLAETKSAIKQAIVDKGVAVADTDTFASYAEKIKGLKTLSTTIKPTYNPKFTGWNNAMLQEYDITRLDTSSMTSMASMFGSCYDAVLDLGNFNTKNVTTMEGMFYGVRNTKVMDLEHFDMSKVTNIHGMFKGCWVQSIKCSTWDTSNVTDMGEFLRDNYGRCKELDTSKWDVSKCTSFQMFWAGINGLTNEQIQANIANWNTASAKGFGYFFYQNTAITHIDVSHFKWDKVGQSGAHFFFDDCTNLEWADIGSCPYIGNGFFTNCSKLTTIIGDHTLEDVENGYVCFSKHNTSQNISAATALERPSLLAILKGIPKVTNKTLTLGSTLLAKLTDEDKQIATDKGWTLA